MTFVLNVFACGSESAICAVLAHEETEFAKVHTLIIDQEFEFVFQSVANAAKKQPLIDHVEVVLRCCSCEHR